MYSPASPAPLARLQITSTTFFSSPAVVPEASISEVNILSPAATGRGLEISRQTVLAGAGPLPVAHSPVLATQSALSMRTLKMKRVGGFAH